MFIYAKQKKNIDLVNQHLLDAFGLQIAEIALNILFKLYTLQCWFTSNRAGGISFHFKLFLSIFILSQISLVVTRPVYRKYNKHLQHHTRLGSLSLYQLDNDCELIKSFLYKKIKLDSLDSAYHKIYFDIAFIS